MNLKKFASFERMITPVIIKILFWVGIALGALSSLGIFISGLVFGFNEGGFMILVGLIGGILVALISFAIVILWTRLVCEIMILAFRMNETLTDIKGLLEQKNTLD